MQWEGESMGLLICPVLDDQQVSRWRWIIQSSSWLFCHARVAKSVADFHGQWGTQAWHYVVTVYFGRRIKRSEILGNIGETLSNSKSYRNYGHRAPTDLIRNRLLCLFIQKSVNNSLCLNWQNVVVQLLLWWWGNKNNFVFQVPSLSFIVQFSHMCLQISFF